MSIIVNVDHENWVVNIHNLPRDIFETIPGDALVLGEEKPFSWFKRAGNVCFYTREAPIVKPWLLVDHLDNLAR